MNLIIWENFKTTRNERRKDYTVASDENLRKKFRSKTKKRGGETIVANFLTFFKLLVDLKGFSNVYILHGNLRVGAPQMKILCQGSMTYEAPILVVQIFWAVWAIFLGGGGWWHHLWIPPWHTFNPRNASIAIVFHRGQRPRSSPDHQCHGRHGHTNRFNKKLKSKHVRTSIGCFADPYGDFGSSCFEKSAAKIVAKKVPQEGNSR